MTHRFGAALFAGALACVLFACPPPSTKPDSGTGEFDAGNPPPRDACSGGCAANQICDVQRRVCVDACSTANDGGGCLSGQTCVKVMEGVYSCRELAVTCNNQLCEPGQVACIAGGCSCLSSARSADDSCRVEGKWCSGAICASPKRYEQCIPGSDTAKCPAGHLCDPVFGEDLAICVKDCAAGGNVCDRGELCAGLDTGAGCLPQGLFRDQECNQHVILADGGFETADGGGLVRVTVPVSNTCLLKDGNGVITDLPGKGSGTCTYAVFRFWEEGLFPFSTCRPPGQAQVGQPCRADRSQGTIATQCATGLECVITSGGDQGVCMKTCNANPPTPGFTPEPACATDEACANIYRYTDPSNNAVLGVCMKSCNAFDPMKNTCAAPNTSCVPTLASGEVIVSADGTGVCIPRQTNVAMPHEPCSETDPFRGAACGDGQLCASLRAQDAAACTPICDLECNPTGGTAPTRCATEPNATCTGGKTCRRVTSTTGSVVGFCL